VNLDSESQRDGTFGNREFKTDNGTLGGRARAAAVPVFELTLSNGGWTFTVLYSIPGSGISATFRNLG
jgi:hypothetical protein